MIDIADKGEFTYIIFDLIKELNELDKFSIKIWMNNPDLVFVFDSTWDILFIQEAIKFMKDDRLVYVPLDSIASMKVYKNILADGVVV